MPSIGLGVSFFKEGKEGSGGGGRRLRINGYDEPKRGIGKEMEICWRSRGENEFVNDGREMRGGRSFGEGDGGHGEGSGGFGGGCLRPSGRGFVTLKKIPIFVKILLFFFFFKDF
jgi:hypothetical protein